MLGEPRREAQLRVAVGRGGVDVVDAVLERKLERLVGLGLGTQPSAAAPKIVRVLSWPVLPNGAFATINGG